MSDDGTIHLALTTNVGSQRLRLEQTLAPVDASGTSTSRSVLTLDGAPLLIIAIAEAATAVTLTLDVSAADAGVRQARLVNDGQTLSGTIDGQAIAPLSISGDPDALRLASGDRPPVLALDPALETALATLLTQAASVARTCQPPPAGQSARRGSRSPWNRVRALPAPCTTLLVRCRFDDLFCLLDLLTRCQGPLRYLCWSLGVETCDQIGRACHEGLDPQDCCAKPGTVCTSRSDCCGIGSTVDCAPIANAKGLAGCGFSQGTRATRCCLTAVGSLCRHDCDCCGDLVCVNGGCTCLRLGARCRRASDCCSSADGQQICAVMVSKVDGPEDSCLVADGDPDARFCCQPDGAVCNDACDCCGALRCRDGVCVALDGPPPLCAPAGEPCVILPCCDGLLCLEGRCLVH